MHSTFNFQRQLNCWMTSGLLAISGQLTAAEQPNIIFILADDLGYGDINCYRPAADQNDGASLTDGSKILTPNMDRLAANGVRFTDFYAGSTVCGPSRASLITGKHGGNCSVRNNVSMKLNETVTFPTQLQARGYETACIGKYGLMNGSYGYLNDADNLTSLPNRKGFDYFYGYLDHSSGHHYFPGLNATSYQQYFPNGVGFANDTSRNPDAKVYELNTGDHLPTLIATDGRYVQDEFTNKAISYLTEKSAGTEPFMLYLAYTIPHAELVLPEAGSAADDVDLVPETTEVKEGSFAWYKTQSFATVAHNEYSYLAQSDCRAAYAAMVTRLDRDIGRLVDHLEATGLADNTLIFISSDNGPHQEGGSNPSYFNSTNSQRGIKRSMHDGGIRTPFIVYGPNHLLPNPGTVNNHIGAFYDMLPTFEDIAGTPTAEKYSGTDGKSIWPTLSGQGTQQQHDYLYWEFYQLHNTPEAGKTRTVQAARKGNWKAVRCDAASATGQILLFDLAYDPAEAVDLAASHPLIVNEMVAIFNAEHTPSTVENPYQIPSSASPIVAADEVTAPDPLTPGNPYALDMSSGSGTYASVSGWKGITGTAARTIECWVKGGGNDQMVIGYGATSGAAGTIVNLGINGNASQGTVGAVRLETGSSAYVGSTVITNGQWHHLAIVFNGSGNFTVYVNGQSEDDTPHNTVTINTGTGPDVQIGRDLNGGRHFSGQIDEIRFWNTALTQSQLQHLADYELHKTAEGKVKEDLNLNWNQLELYYPCNTHTESMQLPDAADSQRDSLLNGSLWFSEGRTFSVLTPALNIQLRQETTHLFWQVDQEIGVDHYQVQQFINDQWVNIEVLAAGALNYATELPNDAPARILVVDLNQFSQIILPQTEAFLRQHYQLQSGWNLISTPGSADLRRQLPSETSAWGWINHHYQKIEETSAGQGLWVWCPSDLTFTLQLAPTEPAPLNLGWNLIGPVKNEALPKSLSALFSWDRTYQNLTDQGLWIQGAGYWGYVNEINDLESFRSSE